MIAGKRNLAPACLIHICLKVVFFFFKVPEQIKSNIKFVLNSGLFWWCGGLVYPVGMK